VYGFRVCRNWRATLAFGVSLGCGHVERDEPNSGLGGFQNANGGITSSGRASALGGSTSGGSSAQGGASIAGTNGIQVGGVPASGGELNRAPTECDAPTPVPFDGGIVECADLSYRRLSPVACASQLPRSERIEYQFDTECWYDSECTAQANGYCDYGTCHYGCITDSDCGDGVCVCGDPVGLCRASECKTAADCWSGYPCMAVDLRYGFFCQRPHDECRSQTDCGPRRFCARGVCQDTPG